jgi:hypothetical protein
VGQDNYFVRLGTSVEPAPVPVGSRTPIGRPGFDPGPESSPRARRRAHRRRVTGRSVFLSLVAAGLIAWAAWATQQPGGVSGTINSFIDRVRGGVETATTGPDLRRAANYFNDRYEQTGTYPRLTEEQMTAAGIGIDIDVSPCGSQAVVLRTLTSSRLLLAGSDLGDVSGRQQCPTSLRDPAPWKRR